MSEFIPADAEELRRVVAWAAGDREPLEVIAGGSKRALGRPPQLPHSLSLARLSAILSYEPNELVLTARAATPLALIEAALAERNQMLAFEPPDWGRLLEGAAPGGQTIGGVLACNLSGPRRLKAGAARDHFLGFAAVSGRGEAFKAGGKVVKNVTGYDLSKLMAGAFGTLAVMSEVTVKVLPRPEETRTVLVFDTDVERALAAMTGALNTPHEVSGAAFLPVELTRGSSVSTVAQARRSIVALRVEGPGPSVAYRCAALRRELAGSGPSDELRGQESSVLWRELRDVGPLVAESGRVLWRVSLAPTSAPAIVRRIAASFDVRYFLDWGGGLLWLAIGGAKDGGAVAIRAAIAGSGHATLLRAPAALRLAVPVFEPEPPALAALTRRVKESFDPHGILNPGRMYRGV
jgi:glycolate oxidase FAD binding subunit